MLRGLCGLQADRLVLDATTSVGDVVSDNGMWLHPVSFRGRRSVSFGAYSERARARVCTTPLEVTDSDWPRLQSAIMLDAVAGIDMLRFEQDAVSIRSMNLRILVRYNSAE